jgi:hypothetical protein
LVVEEPLADLFGGLAHYHILYDDSERLPTTTSGA